MLEPRLQDRPHAQAADDDFDVAAAMRSSYSVALRVQRDHLAGHASALSAVETTAHSVANIHEAVKISIGSAAFPAALQGLKYAEDLLKGNGAQGKAHGSNAASGTHRGGGGDAAGNLWLDGLVEAASAEAGGSSQLLDLLRRARRNQVLMLLDFERRRGVGAGGEVVGAVSPPPRLGSAAHRGSPIPPAAPPRPSRRLSHRVPDVTMKEHAAAEAVASGGVDANQADASLAITTVGDTEPAPMSIRRPAPPQPSVAASTQAAIDLARAKYLARHGHPASDSVDGRNGASPSSDAHDYQSPGSERRHPGAASTSSRLASPDHHALLGPTKDRRHINNSIPTTPIAPPIHGSGGHGRSPGIVYLDDEMLSPSFKTASGVTPIATPRGASPADPRLRTPVDAALARASEVDRAVTHVAQHLFEMHSRTPTPLPGSRPLSSVQHMGFGTPRDRAEHDSPLVQTKQQQQRSTPAPAGGTPSRLAPPSAHPLFSYWMAQRQSFERGRYAEDFSPHTSPWPSRRPSGLASAPSPHVTRLTESTTTIGSSSANFGKSQPTPPTNPRSSADVSRFLQGSAVIQLPEPQIEIRRAAGPATMDIVSQIERLVERSAESEAQYQRLLQSPPPPPTMMQHILAQPNAAAIVMDLVDPSRGLGLYQASEAWHAACVIQRAFRCSWARRLMMTRWNDHYHYVNRVLPLLDALEVVVRVLRGCVARRKYAAQRARVLHLIEERVSLENDAEKQLEWQSTASFSISRGRGKKGRFHLVPHVFNVPFGDDMPSERRLAFRDVQRKIAARIVQNAWRAYQRRAWAEEHNELLQLITIVAKRNEPEPVQQQSEPIVLVNELTLEIPTLDSRVASAGPSSRRNSQHAFLPLKGVKLSELEALRRERDEEERLRRLQLELLMQEKLMRQREILKKRTQAVMLVQRVCRAYRRRLFLFAKKLAQGGGRFLVSANPFMRSVTTHHLRKQVPQHAHSEIVKVIASRNPHLIPEIKREMDARRDMRVVQIQRFARGSTSLVHCAALRRFVAARRVQRWWRIWRVYRFGRLEPSP